MTIMAAVAMGDQGDGSNILIQVLGVKNGKRGMWIVIATLHHKVKHARPIAAGAPRHSENSILSRQDSISTHFNVII